MTFLDIHELRYSSQRSTSRKRSSKSKPPKEPKAPKVKSESKAKSPDYQYCNTLLSRIMVFSLSFLPSFIQNHDDADAFLEPVDPDALGIPDYFDVIKHPMDLSTIHKKLQSGEIQTREEFFQLLRLVFDNALLYNQPGDPV